MTFSDVLKRCCFQPISTGFFAVCLPEKKRRHRWKQSRITAYLGDDAQGLNICRQKPGNAKRTTKKHNMKTTTASPDGGRFSSSQFEANHDKGRGRGLANLGDALARVELAAPLAWIDGHNRPLWRGELVAAWYRGESDPFGLAAVAVAEQTAEDVRMVSNFLRLLTCKIKDNDGAVSDTMREEARGAGLAAVVQWRNGVLECPPVPAPRVAEAVAVVGWRAVSDELSRDDQGHSVELSSVSAEWLAAAVHPDAAELVGGIETRDDRAARWLRERGQARRKASLPAKIDNLRHGHARRVQLVERIEAAAARLVGGDSIDHAARAVGFKARLHGGKVKESAGVQLARAARAVGLVFNLTQPRNGETAADEFNPFRRPVALAGGAVVEPFKPAAAVEPQPLAQPLARLTVGTHCGAACLAAAAVRSTYRGGRSVAQLAARAARRGTVWAKAQAQAAQTAQTARVAQAAQVAALVKRSRVWRKRRVLLPLPVAARLA